MKRILGLAVGVLMALANGPVQGEGICVGLMVDEDSTDARSREAAWKVLSTTPDFDAIRLTGEQIRNGALDKLDVLVFPGGTGSGEGKSLGVDGGRAVTSFVKEGHGLIAICAGAYLVTDGYTDETRAIELVNAVRFDSDNWDRGEQFVAVRTAESMQWDVEKNAVRIDATDTPTSHTMWFENGPIFSPGVREDLPQSLPLVEFVSDVHKPGAPEGMMPGRAAVLASDFGAGRIVTFSTHPELSPGLEHWLQNAVRWTAGRNHGRGASAILEGRQR
jgi:glutamine amidotransferase-like uncharacterized protein